LSVTFCPGCFSEKSETVQVCPSCQYDESLKRSPVILSHHIALSDGHYVVGRVIGKPGGFGITYLGWDQRLQTRVAIKEYLPRDVAGRDADHHTVVPHSGDDEETFGYGLDKFLEEARTLARLDHPNIVRVRDFFKANGTAYIVMDYYDGLTVSEYLGRQSGGKMPEAASVSVMLAILDGLREVHRKGFLHRDIKPQNIYLTTGNRPILLDFGAARQSVGEHSRSLSVVVSEGYAPIEQYQRNAQQGPWTDIYGVAATLYYMVTGRTPSAATDRITDESLPGLEGISANLRAAITRGMASNPEVRIRTVEEFQDVLAGVAVKSRPASAARPAAVKTASAPIQRADGILRQDKPKNGLWWVAAAVVLFLMIFKPFGQDSSKPSSHASSTSAPPSTSSTHSNLPTQSQNTYSTTPYTPPSSPPVTRPITPPAPVIPVAPPPAASAPSDSYTPPMPPADPSVANSRAVIDAERVRWKMRGLDGAWTAERYRKAYAAFAAAEQADSQRMYFWRAEGAYALAKASQLDAQPAPNMNPTNTSLPPSTPPASRDQARAIADGERVLGKMQRHEGEWTAQRYRAAYAAYKAAEEADPARRDIWKSAQSYALQMANAGQSQASSDPLSANEWIDRYLKPRVVQAWRKPLNVISGNSCEVRLHLYEDAGVARVQYVNSSCTRYDTDFENSTKTAVREAGPFPLPQDGSVRAQVMNGELKLNFTSD
jgi:serine/threonine protein kinase